MESWGPGMRSFNASTMNLGDFVQNTVLALPKNIIGTFWYNPQGQLKVLENLGPWPCPS